MQEVVPVVSSSFLGLVWRNEVQNISPKLLANLHHIDQFPLAFCQLQETKHYFKNYSFFFTRFLV